MAETTTYRLSSIDQSLIRTYNRVCYCFPHDDSEAEIARITQALTASVKQTVNHFPILAGHVYPIEAKAVASGSLIVTDGASANHELQSGRLEVRVTEEDIKKFKPTISHLDQDEFPDSYNDLVEHGMPAGAFISDILTPIPDMADPAQGHNVVFAVQGNLIKGGILVSICLHHSVADIYGLATIVHYMSSTEHGHVHLQDDAIEQSRIRDRLSGSRGVRSNAIEHPEYATVVRSNGRRMSLAPVHGSCYVLSFDLKMLEATKDMANERYNTMLDRPEVRITVDDIFVALLWKAVARARWVGEELEDGQTSSLLLPVNMRKKLDPPLTEDYYGNACLFGYSTSSAIRLILPLDVCTLASTAHLIHTSKLRMNEAKLRSTVAFINEKEDVRSVNHPAIDFSNDVFISDWSELEEATLGLGLGPAGFVRKPSRKHSSYGCVLLPPKKNEGVWEVLVQMTDEAMGHLLEDPGVKPFVLRVA